MDFKKIIELSKPHLSTISFLILIAFLNWFILEELESYLFSIFYGLYEGTTAYISRHFNKEWGFYKNILPYWDEMPISYFLVIIFGVPYFFFTNLNLFLGKQNKGV